MKLTSVAVALLLSLSATAMPVADIEGDTPAALEARRVKCRFKHEGWKNVKCFLQGGDWSHSWFEITPNYAINAKNLIFTSCNIKDIPAC
ncbi:uncharacterized protein NFIA_092680 [Aspergillus fischeri NRRL 181]|uniref:Uncharacterized protein n=1 Tax=Neosartorya fischeri (strain ATCC 1020 / DSM 3700 / CBS 544.65 / FGSC A1164 / JCM 1740 / NRRL 181 / WB 181) TaxID=331117 RepID=A1DIV0_NEOFI|nr:uncharacterized protein NFIA_092680 [Aspergillus fischeri NRRL 181]EAW19307.1 hypothetical protein NFIA_092680 [Aspergillus fischeri NRRL 181]